MLSLIPQILKALPLPAWMIIASSIFAKTYRIYRERYERRLKLQKDQLDAIKALCEKNLTDIHPLVVEESIRFSFGGIAGKDVLALAFASTSPARFIADFLKGRKFLEIRDCRLLAKGKYKCEKTRRNYMFWRNKLYYIWCVFGTYPLLWIPSFIISGQEKFLLPLGFISLSMITFGFFSMDSYFCMEAADKLLKETAELNTSD